MIIILKINRIAVGYKSVSIDVRLIERKDMRYYYIGKMFNKKNDIIFVELPSIH